MNMNADTLEGHPFSVTLAMIRLGHIDAPEAVFTVDLHNDLVVTDHGDVDVHHHRSHGHASIYDYGSAGTLADAIEAHMEDYGTGTVVIWFEGMTVHYAGLPALDRTA